MTKEANNRLLRITENLRTETSFKNRFSGPQSLTSRMAKRHTPAVSLAIIDDYKITSAGAFGLCEAGKPQPIDQSTLFLAGSISKPVFASAVMYLAQEDQLNLDEDINTYLKAWKVPDNDGWQPRITLRQLLSHTAGLTVHGFPGYQTTETIPTPPEILDGGISSNTPRVEVNILPGLQFRYSGGGTTVAQLAVTDYLDEAFPALMQRLVFEPIGMINSTFENPLPSSLTSNAATAHPWKSIPLRGRHHIYPEMAAAGLWTTPTDLASFGLTLQKGLRGDDTGFLNQETLETMLSHQLTNDKDSEEYVSLGFFCKGKNETAFFGHGGWDEGFIAELRLHKTLGKGAVVMLNSNEGFPLLEEIIRAVAEEYDWPIPPEAKQSILLPNLADYAGLYKSEHGQLFKISINSNGLTLEYDQQPAVPFTATSEVNFFSKTLNTELGFEKDDEDSIVSLTILQGGIRINATRTR